MALWTCPTRCSVQIATSPTGAIYLDFLDANDAEWSLGCCGSPLLTKVDFVEIKPDGIVVLQYDVTFRMYLNQKMRVLAGCRELSFPYHICRQVLRSKLYKVKVAPLALDHGEM